MGEIQQKKEEGGKRRGAIGRQKKCTVADKWGNGLRMEYPLHIHVLNVEG